MECLERVFKTQKHETKYIQTPFPLLNFLCSFHLEIQKFWQTGQGTYGRSKRKYINLGKNSSKNINSGLQTTLTS